MTYKINWNKKYLEFQMKLIDYMKKIVNIYHLL